jgi:hypothetical protein
MPVTSSPVRPPPAYWRFYGHSYLAGSFGGRTQMARCDAILRNVLDIEQGLSIVNHAVVGSRLTFSVNNTGGWTRVFQNEIGWRFGTGGYPYVSQNGAYFLGWGINDVGFNGQNTQNNTAYQNAMRAVISRCRMSTLYDDDAASGIAYGAGFTSVPFSWDTSSGNSYREATTTTSATVTITLPADYHGETVAICWLSKPGVLGGTITYSGTAGVTGTTSTSNILPATLTAGRIPVVRRITNLTAANAGQTIICTVTAIDAGGVVDFDGFWLESAFPPPVLVCNTARLTTAGYTAYVSGIGDADVVTFNAVLTSLAAEFDGMVQIVDIDSAINKDALALQSDGLHPSELGAARIADATLTALARINPASAYGPSSQLNVPNLALTPVMAPKISGFWYTSPAYGTPPTTGCAATAGDLTATPIYISEGNDRLANWSVETLTGTTAATVMFGIYDDHGFSGGPKYLFANPCATAVTLLTGAGVFNSAGSGNGSLGNLLVEPGLYWLAMLVVTAGTGSVTFRSLKGPCDFMPNMTTGGQYGTTPSVGVTTASGTPVGWKATGVATTAMPTTWPFPNAPTLNVVADYLPALGVKLT